MRISELFENEEPARIKLGAGSAAAQSWIERVYAKYPQTMQNNHVMTWGSGDDLQFAMFELTPSFSKRGAVEVKWFQAYPLRQGVGSRAMKELQALAREDGISLTLFPWDKGQVSQSKLTKFYRGQGFAPGVKGGKAMQWTPDQPGVAEGSLNESAVFLNPTTVVVGQAHGQPLELSPDTLKKIQDIAAKHGAWYEGNGTDRSYTKGQIDRYVGSWDDEVAKTASPNDPKWLYVLFANVDENNRVKRVGVDPKDTIFNRLMDSAQDNSFQGIGYTARALQKFLQMASEDQYDFVKMSQQPATQENLTRFLKAGEALMWPSNWEQYPNRAGKIAKAATVDVRDQYLASRKAGVYVTGSGHLKAVQNITDQQGVAEAETATQNSRQLAKEFRQLGYSQIGSGADATVWARDDSHVIKILMPEDAGSRAEQIFRKFYEFSITHQDLACVPRFNEVNTIDINGKEYTQIEMERLAPIEKGTFMEGVVWLLSDYVAEQMPWPTIESELAMPDTWEMYSPNYANALARTWQSLLENPAGRKTYVMYRQLYNVMKLLFTTGTINKFGWDLHTANVMRRNNGQPVIIDPWFSQGTS